MKLKILLIATLLALFAIAPALAASDQTYYADPMILKDDSGIQIELNSIVASDEPYGSITYSYPSSQYKYYRVYYTLYNPTDHDIRFQFDLTFVDSNGTVFTTDDNILGYGLGAGRRVSDYFKEYPIPRNASGLYMRWHHLNTYVNEYEWTNIAIQSQPAPTPTAVPTATAVPSATPVPSPTSTAKPTPVNGLLPLAALGMVVCGFCAVRVYSDYIAKRR
jgi:hypothetical protein